MQEHEYHVDVEGSLEDVWEVFWYRADDRPQPRDVTTRIEILHPGDEVGEGLVRHCYFPVPRFLGSGGVGQSWEWLTQVKHLESWRYNAIGKPLWSHAEGFTRLEDIGGGKTRVRFRETYEAFNPWMRRLGLEKYVHRRISRDNDTILAALQGGVRWHQKRKSRSESTSTSKSGFSAR